MVFNGYPPTVHILGDLGIAVEVRSAISAHVRMRATPHIAAADGGVRAGVLATLVDIVGGAVAVRTLHPDWMATADLTLQIVRPTVGPWVEARGTVLRQGRTTLVLEAMVYNVEEDGTECDVEGGVPQPAAWATMTFAVLPARDPATAPPLSTFPVAWAFEGDGLDGPVADVLGMVVEDAVVGRVSLPVVEYLFNSFGAVQGGVMALLGDVAGTEAVAASPASGGEPVVVTDLEVVYLALGKVGPMVSRARTVGIAGAGRGSAGRGCAVVELVDSGADDRLTTVVTVGTSTLASLLEPSAS
jgi:uncharacterized protein (TIGR00369 family)